MSNARALIDHISKIVSHFNENASVPTGAMLDWAMSTAPSGFILCDGATLLEGTPHSKLRSALIADGFPHGQDGSGNHKIPDAKGRVTAGKDNMGGTAAGRLTTASGGVDGAVLGAAGGSSTHTLTTAQMPSHTHPNTLSDPGHVHSMYYQFGGASGGSSGQAGVFYPGTSTNTLSATPGITITNVAQGSGAAHPIVQHTLVVNKIIKT